MPKNFEKILNKLKCLRINFEKEVKFLIFFLTYLLSKLKNFLITHTLIINVYCENFACSIIFFKSTTISMLNTNLNHWQQ